MNDHYFSKTQDSKLILKQIVVQIKRNSLHEFKLWSASGLFSKEKLDNATKLLIENCIIKDKWRVLDLGCGYGALGISLKKINASLDVVMSDVNSRAIGICQKNISMHKLPIEVIESDLFERIEGKFDSIMVNPPYAAGREVCIRMIEDSFSHLKKGGLLQLVARHNKGGSRLADDMKRVFGNMEPIAKQGGFRVYCSKCSTHIMQTQ